MPLAREDRWLTGWLIAAPLISIILIGINNYCFHYSWVVYFPREFAPCLFVALQFAWFGRRISEKSPDTSYLLTEASYYALAMIALAFLVTGIQLTPFPPIDLMLSRWDRALGYSADAVLTWTCGHRALRAVLMVCYASTDIQLFFVPMIALFSRDRRRLRIYLYAIVYSFFLGNLIYYFFPSSGPASLSTLPLFTDEQRSTFMKFSQVHAGLPVTTIMGGMIAFPSFHVAWSVLLPYVAAGRRAWFWPVAALNAVAILSTLLLGWHYLVDVPAGILLAALSLCAGRVTDCRLHQLTPERVSE